MTVAEIKQSYFWAVRRDNGSKGYTSTNHMFMFYPVMLRSGGWIMSTCLHMHFLPKTLPSLPLNINQMLCVIRCVALLCWWTVYVYVHPSNLKVKPSDKPVEGNSPERRHYQHWRGFSGQRCLSISFKQHSQHELNSHHAASLNVIAEVARV